MGSLQRPLSCCQSGVLVAAAPRLFAALFLAIFIGGCTASRSVQIVTRPPDAIIRIDGVVRGKGRVVEDLRFGAGRAYTVMVSRLGFNDVLTTLDSAPPEGKLQVNL